jgi:hypothetical protein
MSVSMETVLDIGAAGVFYDVLHTEPMLDRLKRLPLYGSCGTRR